MTLLRLFRGYCDNHTVIPAEQLHRDLPLRYFEREVTLFRAGLSRLAGLQAPVAGVTARERQDTLTGMFGRLKDLARDSGDLAPFDQALLSHGVAGLLAKARDERSAEELDRVVTHAFSSLLDEARDWPSKILAILRFHAGSGGGAGEGGGVIDEFLCETIDGREPVKALVGAAPSLAAALLALLATLDGALDGQLPNTPPLLKLSQAMEGGSFPHTREAILRRVRKAMESANPLTRVGGVGETRAFQTLVKKLAHVDGFHGGPEMAAALVRRGKVAWGSTHHDLPFEDTVARLESQMDWPIGRIGFLLDLAASEFGRRRTSHLVQRVAAIFEHAHSAHDLAPPGVPVEEVRVGLGARLGRANIPRALANALIARIVALPLRRRDDDSPDFHEALTIDLSAMSLTR